MVQQFAPLVNSGTLEPSYPLPSGNEMGDIGFIPSPKIGSCLPGNQFSPLLDMELELARVSVSDAGGVERQDVVETGFSFEVCADS